MKNNFHSIPLIFLFVFLMITTSYSLARNMIPKQGEVDDQNMKNFISNKELSVVETGSTTDFFDKLMGQEEECGDEDEECLKRRVVLEAHLDYIYTQNHKP